MQSHSSTTSCLLLILLLIYFSPIQTQNAVLAPAPSLYCTRALLNLTSCLTFVTSGSNLTRPEKGCCSALAEVLANEVSCLCQLIGGSDNFGLHIDTVRVLELPTICRVNAPPSNLCSKVGAPIGTFTPPSKGPNESSVPPIATPANRTDRRSCYVISTLLQLSFIALCLIL